MGKWAEYRVQDNTPPVASKWEQYKILPQTDNASDMQEEDIAGDSWPALIGKSALKGATSIADLPRLAEEVIAYPRNKLADFVGMPSLKYEPMIPTTDDARAKIKEYTNVDLEPSPSSAGQRIASHAAEWAAPGGIFGAFSKAGRLGNIAKQSAVGTGIGAASGSMQEVGVNPLLADIGAIAAPYGLAGGVKKLGAMGNKIFPSTEESASRILKDKVGKKNLPSVLEKLDTKSPFNAPATTAELAENTGIASLHRAMSPNIPAIAENQAIADKILRGKLEGIAPTSNSPAYSRGEVIRGQLDKNLQNAKSIRAETTEPLYDALYNLEHGVALPKTREFLKGESKYAKGDIKKNLGYIDELIRSNKASSKTAKSLQEYKDISPAAMEKILADVNMNPTPGEVRGVLTEITDKYKSAKKAGNDNLARIYKDAKDNILADMAHIPEERIAREAYANLSKPVSAIEKEPMLKRFVKKDEFGTDYLLSPEKIPQAITAGSINNTKTLMQQAAGNPKLLNNIRGSFVSELLNKSSLSSIGAGGERNLSYDKFNKFLKTNKGKLELVFDKDQIKILNEAKDLLRRRNMVQTMGRAAGSNTQSETTLLAELTGPVSKIGSKALKTIPGGKVALPVYEALQNTQKQAIKDVLADALINPEKAKLLLTPTKNIKSVSQLNDVLARLSPMTEDVVGMPGGDDEL